MSRGSARSAIRRRIETIVAGHKMPSRDSVSATDVKDIRVFEQFPSLANDGTPRIPGAIVALHDDSEDDDVETYLVPVTVAIATYAIDTESGFADPENLVEAIKIDLKSKPYCESFKLKGPWQIGVMRDAKGVVFQSTLSFNVELLATQATTGPNGETMGV
ncbi:MAG: hypothetical protein ABFD54_15040 [Armatimonadota bacterium]|nr:hypothetical protein [bacterium]